MSRGQRVRSCRHPTPQPARQALATVFLLSLVVVLLQVVLSRLFVGLIYNDFYYFPIAMALLGLCAGSVHLVAFSQPSGLDLETQCPIYVRRAFWALLVFAAALVAINEAATLLIDSALVRERAEGDFTAAFFRSRVWLLLAYSPACVLPFYFLGMAIASVFRARPSSVHAIYGCDLAGAALGAVLGIPALSYLTALNAVLIGAAILAASLIAWRRECWRLLAAVLFGMIVVQVADGPSLGALTLRGLSYSDHSEVVADGWAATAYMQLIKSREDEDWGVLQDHHSYAKGFDAMSRSNWTPPWLDLVEQIRGRPRSVVVLAAGLGKQMKEARDAGVEEIYGTEMNPFLAGFAERHVPESRLSDLYAQPGVHYVRDEARHFLRSTTRRFDVVMLPPAGRAATTLSLAPDQLLTEEAIVDYLRSLTDDGVVVIAVQQPWEDRDPSVRAGFLQLIRRGLQRAGLGDPDLHVVARPPLLLISRSALSAETLARLAPGLEVRRFGALVAGLPAVHKHATDDFPFWTGGDSYGRWGSFLRGASTAGEAPRSMRAGMSLVAVVLSLLVILLPLLASRRMRASLQLVEGPRLLYFFCLGTGFMFVEIPLMQRLALALGSPTYSISFCLVVLLSATGIGSLASNRLLRPDGALRPLRLDLVLVMIIALQLSLYAVLPRVIDASAGLSGVAQYSLIALTLTPLGLLLGAPFPHGLRLLDDHGRSDLIPWAWGINGAASVMAVTVSLALIRIEGVSRMFVIAAGFYLLALCVLHAGFTLRQSR